jgi:hypothetical protein
MVFCCRYIQFSDELKEKIHKISGVGGIARTVNQKKKDRF